MNEFKNQVAVITGAASGIGLSISRRLIKEGATVALLDIDKELLKKEFQEVDAGIQLFPIDVTDQKTVDDTIKSVQRIHGKIDILINCAGITGITNTLSHNVTTENLRKVFEINFMSSFLYF